MSTAERVRLPDDCTVGYIVEGLLGARLLHSSLFHSHLENLQKLPPDTLLQQVGWLGPCCIHGRPCMGALPPWPPQLSKGSGGDSGETTVGPSMAAKFRGPQIQAAGTRSPSRGGSPGSHEGLL